MSNTGAPRIPEIAGKPKARGAGQPPRKYTLWEWTKGYLAWIAAFPLYCLFWILSGHTLPKWIVRKLLLNHQRTSFGRSPDVRIPYNPDVNAYMLRWWKTKRNALMNIYYHIVLRSDDDRAHHDHPWWSFSIVLEGGYFEHRILAGGIHSKIWHGPGTMLFRWHGKLAHRLELANDEERELPAKTIFVTGPVLRRWGFHDSKRWVDAFEWDDYCETNGIQRNPIHHIHERIRTTTEEGLISWEYCKTTLPT